MFATIHLANLVKSIILSSQNVNFSYARDNLWNLDLRSNRKVWEETGYFNGEVKKQGKEKALAHHKDNFSEFLIALPHKFSILKALRKYNENFEGVKLNIFHVVKENVTIRQAAKQYTEKNAVPDRKEI